MAWLRIDDRLRTHPKFQRAGIAGWLAFCGISYCREHLTDGVIPREAVKSLAPGLKRPDVHAAKLVEVGLWHMHPLGFEVHDFLDWNPTKVEVVSLRDNERTKKQKWRSVPEGQPRDNIDEDPRDISNVPEGHDRDTSRARAGGRGSGLGSGSGSRSGSAEESARETISPAAPTWSHQPRGTPLVGNHARCFFAPEACARGLCIRAFLGQEWRQQGAADDEIRGFVAATIASLPSGPIGDEPLKFWRAAWSAQHGSQAPAPAVPAGSRQRASEITLATLRRNDS